MGPGLFVMRKERYVMLRNRVMSVLAIAACGVLLTGGGIAAASAPAADARASAPAAGGAGAAPASGGTVRFTAYANDDLPRGHGRPDRSDPATSVRRSAFSRTARSTPSPPATSTSR